ncbi:hypothetical protein ABKA04_008757 [Annulohypoxylon sp. FPYF3050]
MEQGGSIIREALQGIVPEQALDAIQEHLQDPSTTVKTVWHHTSAVLNKVGTMLSPLFAPIFARAIQALYDSPDVVVLAFFLGTFVLMLQIVIWIHRTMMYMTRLAFRLMGWALFIALLAVVWRRGPEATIRDVVVFVSKMAGYATLVKDIWLSEYKKFDAQTKRGGDFTAGQRAPSGGSSRSGNNGW